MFMGNVESDIPRITNIDLEDDDNLQVTCNTIVDKLLRGNSCSNSDILERSFSTRRLPNKRKGFFDIAKHRWSFDLELNPLITQPAENIAAYDSGQATATLDAVQKWLSTPQESPERRL
jgi:hypothetical protein